MEENIKQGMALLSRGVEVGAGIIVGMAALEAMLRSMYTFFFRRGSAHAVEEVRLRLGRWLVLALEFELAADILLTAVAPTWDEIGKLAAIVVLRTVLNYFLQHDIADSPERQNAPNPS